MEIGLELINFIFYDTILNYCYVISIGMKIIQHIQHVPYQDAFALHKAYAQHGEHPALVMESRSANRAYDTVNLVAPTQALKVYAKDDAFSIQAISDVGGALLNLFKQEEFPFAKHIKRTSTSIDGIIKAHDTTNLTHTELLNKPHSGHVIDTVLSRLGKHISYPFAGLYGAFSYDFARQFVNLPRAFSSETNDFTLFFPSNIFYLDSRREAGEHMQLEVDGIRDDLQQGSRGTFVPNDAQPFQDMSFEAYAEKVQYVVDAIKRGRLMQCVLSRDAAFPLRVHPLDSYEKLRNANPSPYSFFFDLGDELVYGASPETHIKVNDSSRDGKAIEIRPIAGTARRTGDSVQDFHTRQELLSDPKEMAEHTMLVDLARNDLYQLVLPDSVSIPEFGIIEEYPNLYHIVTGVTGTLRDDISATTALLATLPAGTLSGAPKREAMQMIDELEHSARDYYGGAVGYLTVGGNCNTGITIRSVHVRDGFSHIRSGAGIVLQSHPDGEVAEIQTKAEKAKGVVMP